jgi:hypothetical protein
MGDLHLQIHLTWHCCSRSTSQIVYFNIKLRKASGSCHLSSIGCRYIDAMIYDRTHVQCCENIFKRAAVCVLVLLVLNAYRNNFK